MSQKYHIQGVEFTSDDELFVRQRISGYVANLSPALRTASTCPVETHRGTMDSPNDLWPFTAPPEMWEGVPDSNGLVVWRGVCREPGLRGTDYPPRPSPPLFGVYWCTWSLVRFFVPHPELPFLLSSRSDDSSCFCVWRNCQRWVGSRWSDGTGYTPFGISEDRQWLVCFDSRQALTSGDMPVVALPVEVVFRSHEQPNREEIEKHARVLYPSFRALLDDPRVHGKRRKNPGSSPVDRVPAGSAAAVPFDWAPWLQPEPGPEENAPDQSRAKIDWSVLEGCWARLRAKVEALRRADPAFFLPGADRHGYRFHPVLLEEERQAFEQTRNCQLPDAYARFLMTLGNGGPGPGEGLQRLEWSAPKTWAEPRNSRKFDKVFPHRSIWRAEPGMTYNALHHARQIHGTISLGWVSGKQTGLAGTVLLVVKGPERGHVWMDARNSSGTIHPICRRGPLSLLAWYEQGLDHLLGSIDRLYAERPASPEPYQEVVRRAFRLDGKASPPRSGGEGQDQLQARSASEGSSQARSASKRTREPVPLPSLAHRACVSSPSRASPEALALLQAIADQPDNNNRRLIFSDWLEEHGDLDWASLIRVQVRQRQLPAHDAEQVALLHLERSLLRVQKAALLSNLPVWARSLVSIERGVLGHVRLTAGQFLEQFADLYRLAPLSSVQLTGTHGLWDRLANCPSLAWLRSLTIDRNDLDADDVKALARSPHIRSLEALDLGWNDLGVNGLRALVSQQNRENLKRLDVRRNYLGSAGMNVLRGWPLLNQIEELLLGFNDIDRSGLDGLLDSPHLPELVALNLDSSDFGDEGAAHLLRHPSMSRLTRLELYHTNTGRKAMKALAEATHITNLRHLGVGYSRIDAAGVRALASAPHLGTLNVLVLEGNGIGTDLGTRLASSPHLTGLVEAHLDGNKLGDKGLRALAGSPVLDAIRKLDVSANELTDAGVEALARSEHAGRLMELDIGSQPLTEQSARSIASSRWLANLVSLNLSYSDLGSGGIEALASSPHLSQLSELTLYHTSVGTKGAKALAKSPLLKNLTVLDLSNTRLGSKGIATLAGSANLANLTVLRVEENRIGTAGAKAIADSPYSSNLIELKLDDNRIDSLGASALADSPHLVNLRNLWICQNRIGPEGAIALASSATLAGLTELNLYNCRIGNSGAQAILDSPHLKGITWLNVLNNGIDADLVRRLDEWASRTPLP